MTNADQLFDLVKLAKQANKATLEWLCTTELSDDELDIVIPIFAKFLNAAESALAKLRMLHNA